MDRVRQYPGMLGVNQYGKAETHLVRVVRDGDVHELRDLLVSVALSGALEAVHLEGDNRAVLATDTQKNTVYAFAKEFGVGTPEEFATLLARHFLGGAITRARVQVVEVAWARLSEHAFVQSSRVQRVATAICPMAPGIAMRFCARSSGIEKWMPTPNISRITPSSASSLAVPVLATRPGVNGPITTPARR